MRPCAEKRVADEPLIGQQREAFVRDFKTGVRMQMDRQAGLGRTAAVADGIGVHRPGNVGVEDAVLDRDGDGRERAARRVEAAAGEAIELPAVQRALEARALVVDGAALMGADVGQQREPRRLPHQEVAA